MTLLATLVSLKITGGRRRGLVTPRCPSCFEVRVSITLCPRTFLLQGISAKCEKQACLKRTWMHHGLWDIQDGNMDLNVQQFVGKSSPVSRNCPMSSWPFRTPSPLNVPAMFRTFGSYTFQWAHEIPNFQFPSLFLNIPRLAEHSNPYSQINHSLQYIQTSKLRGLEGKYNDQHSLEEWTNPPIPDFNLNAS